MFVNITILFMIIIIIVLILLFIMYFKKEPFYQEEHVDLKEIYNSIGKGFHPKPNTSTLSTTLAVF